MRYIVIALILLFSASIHAAEFIPKKLSQMTDDLGVGTHTADTIDPHGTTLTQTNLTITGNLNATITGFIAQNGGTGTGNVLTNTNLISPIISYVQNDNGYFTNIMIASGTGTLQHLVITDSLSIGTATVPGLIKQISGTASGTQLTSVQINSGTGTLSAATIAGVAAPYVAQNGGTGTLSQATIAGIAAPYIKQANGTGTGLTLSGTNIINGVTAPYISQSNGTGTLSEATIAGVAAPYIAQSNGTGTGITLAGITDLGTTSINVSGTPLIDLAIGDTDTGIKWNSDGNIDLYSNNSSVLNITPSALVINDTLSITGGNAHIKIGTTTQDGSARITSNGLVSVKSGGVKFPDGNTQTEAVTQLVKGIVAGTGISIDQSTGTVTVTNTGIAVAGGWTDGTNTVYTTVAADQVIIGSTTSSGRQLTCVGSSTFYGQVAIGSGTTALGASAPTLLEIAIGDSDTGLKWDGDGILSLYGNASKEITIDGNTNKTRIGTTTAGTKLNVGGTVTAEGFSGNGAGLTGIAVAFSAVTGSATASQLPTSLAEMTFTGNSNFPSGIWNSSGNVGIGTTTPGSKLSVTSGLSVGANYGVAAPTNGLIVEGNVGIGTVVPGMKLQINGDPNVAALYTLGGGESVYGLVIIEGNSTNGAYLSIIESAVKGWSVGIDDGDDDLKIRNNNRTGDVRLMIAGDTGNVGIGTSTPNNILTLPIASGTDPIADSWTQHCLADYKDIGTETAEMIQLSANDKIKSVPVSSYTKKALISDEEAEREVKQKYQGKIRESAKADLELYTTETGVAMQDNSYVDELLESMWETKADRITLIETNKEKLVAEKKALPKFQRKNYGIVAEDAPPEAQVFDKNGNLQGIDPSALVGILWANAQKQEIRISTLEAEIEKLKTILNP